MFTINTISKKMLKISVFVTCVLAVVATAVTVVSKHFNNEVDAASSAGDTATISSDGRVRYGDPNHDPDGTSHYYATVGGVTYRGYCANPSLFYPVGDRVVEVPSENEDNNVIRFLIYLSLIDTENQNLMNEMYSWVSESWVNDLNLFPDNPDYSNRVYAMVHATIGAISNDYASISGDAYSQVRDKLNAAVAKVKQLISSNSAVWQQAQMYTLRGTRIDPGPSGTPYQSVVWIEPMYGNIKVQKLDNDTGNAVPQGDASLAGIHFEVVRTSDNQVVADGLTGADGTVTFAKLLVGVDYKVRETVAGSTNASYEIADQETDTINLTTSGHTFSVKDSIKRGDVTINKVDKETQSCTNKANGLSFAGTKFQIINNSTNAVVINGTSYAKNAVIKTETFSANTCSVKFDNLPYGNYIVKETEAATGYELNSNPINVTIPTNNNYSISKKFENQPIRGDVKFVKVDKNSNTPMSNTVFSISALDKNNSIKETHLVVSNQNGVVDTSSSFIQHSIHTNGYDSLYDAGNSITFLGYGAWFGIDSNNNMLPVNNDLGALPYGTYIVQELKCDANLFCNDITDQKKTIKITTAKQIVDLGNWDNACAEFELQTTATDAKDDDSVVEEGDEVTIKDAVEYCAKANMDFTIKGVLMDKATGEPLLVDGKTVESEVAINSDTDCGSIDMYFTFDATGLGGKDLVVFEELYYGEELLVAHKDLGDENQTVHIFKLTTIARNKETLDKVLPLDTDVVVEDLVQYCVLPGYKYKISGILMDKSTGKGVLINGKPVEQSVVIEPEEACGELVMEYPINTTGLGGAELVIFETLYAIDDSRGDEEPTEYELISHEDLNNESETVRVEPPVPDTGYITKTSESGSESNTTILVIGASALVLGGYIILRKSAKRRVMKF